MSSKQIAAVLIVSAFMVGTAAFVLTSIPQQQPAPAAAPVSGNKQPQAQQPIAPAPPQLQAPQPPPAQQPQQPVPNPAPVPAPQQPAPAQTPPPVKISVVLVEARERKWIPSIAPFTVTKGQNVTLTIINGDDETEHQFVIPDFKVDSGKLDPEQQKTITFVADKVGKFQYLCPLKDEQVGNEFVKHSEEGGFLTVVG
jgi:outer membrane biosynthesis protein TonB